MAGNREPIELIQAKGKKHLTKAEIAERKAREVQPCTDEIHPPRYLTATQKRQFEKLARQLLKIKIMGETDVEGLARYVAAQSLYEQATKRLQAFLKESKPDYSDPELTSAWAKAQEDLSKQQDRYFKQAHTAASALGLTISSRCKLEVPVLEEQPRQNKFARFADEGDDDD